MNIDDRALLYTDGSCWPNPGPGGWGVVALCRGGRRELQGRKNQTTSNEMELTAIHEGLRFAIHEWSVSRFIVFSDSKYAISCVSRWHYGWRRNGWMTSGRKRSPVRHKELILAITNLISTNRLVGRFEWVRGHSGNPFNERADELASRTSAMG